MIAAAQPRLSDQDARERIRTALDRSLLVEAAAGTGKTTELVYRMVAALEAGARVGEMVAVTFTHKAAGELKLRLREELDRRLRHTASSHLEHALAHLEEASVGTIHGFCAQILRERPAEARIDPAFRELAEPEAGRLRDRALRWWFQRQLDVEAPALRRALERMAGNSSPATTQLKFAFLTLLEWRDYTAPWQRLVWDRERAIDAIVDRVIGIAPHLNDKFQCVRRTAERITRAEEVRTRDYDSLEALLVSLLSDLKRLKRKGAEDLIGALEEFRDRADADLAPLLREELRLAVQRYQVLKRKTSRLDFLDLLLCARDLVRHHAAVRQELQRRYRHIFIDEFQDTDPLQAELLLLLAADDPNETDWRKATPVPGKLFVVGDPKQSIYKFRRADVSLYTGLRERLGGGGAEHLELSHSFRAVAPIQRFINRAFADVMPDVGYVPLRGQTEGLPEQPAVIALPVPKPYGSQRLSRKAIDASLPSATAAFVAWLVEESGWQVRESGQWRPIQRHDVCLLFRRFLNYGEDITRDYARGLEARGIPHVLVGSRSFHNREEVETLRAAMTAVEWPADELAVYATLRGALFAIDDATLWRYRSQVGRPHPFGKRPPPDEFPDVVAALDLLAELHRARNRRPAADTLQRLLSATRAHAGFAMRKNGHQVLANVHRVAELARAHEQSGGVSFRGFVEELEAQAARSDSSEAPVMEPGADGVRIMTVHQAKGLEFPVVILCDLTANLASREPDRYLKGDLCASRLLWCAPAELREHAAEEQQRERYEGIRLAYVASTRARDLLVIPAVGDRPLGDGNWLEPLEAALYPEYAERRGPKLALGCPQFGERSVLERPFELEQGPETSVKPGLHGEVVWWDPAALELQAESQHGLRLQEILKDDGLAAQSIEAYRQWQNQRSAALDVGSTESVRLLLPSLAGSAPPSPVAVDVVAVPRQGSQPSGRRFGAIVHAALRDATLETVEDAVSLQARIAGGTAEELTAAVERVSAALRHPLLNRAHRAERLLREAPLSVPLVDGEVLEGVLDLAFLEAGEWTIVDFKTDADLAAQRSHYERQLQWYAHGLRLATGLPVRAVLMTL